MLNSKLKIICFLINCQFLYLEISRYRMYVNKDAYRRYTVLRNTQARLTQIYT